MHIHSISNTQYLDFKINQFSEFFLHKNFNNSPLPVALTNFSATCDNNITLSWTTASEQNSDRYIIEKSRDGQTWAIVAEQAAAGNSNTLINYSQVDENSWNGTAYYRLRQLDFNGEQEVFGPISVSCNANENTMIVYPNPGKGAFTVEISSDAVHPNANLVLTDMTGKIISSQKVNVAIGKTHLMMDHLDLQMGTYMIQIRNADAQLKPVKMVINR